MKKLLIILMVVAMASFLFVGCLGVTPDIDEDVAVTGVTLVPATLALTAGGATGTLVATVAPADATDPRITWASSVPAVATVALGVVTPLTAGLTAITVTTVDGGFVATCVVTVAAEGVPAPTSTTPTILDIQKSDGVTSIVDLTSTKTQYINKTEAGTSILVEGIAGPKALVQVYIGSAATPVSAGTAGTSGLFSVVVAKTALGADSLVAKTLHVTSVELGLEESAASNVATFILDTDLPGIKEVKFTAFADLTPGEAEVTEGGTALTVTGDDLPNITSDEIETGTWTIDIIEVGAVGVSVKISGPDFENTYLYLASNHTFVPGAPIPGVEFTLLAVLEGAEHSEIVCTAEVDEILARATLKFDEDVSYAAATATTCFYGGSVVEDVPYVYKEANNTGYWWDIWGDIYPIFQGVSYTITVYDVKDLAGNVGGTEDVPLTKSAIAGAASETLLEP